MLIVSVVSTPTFYKSFGCRRFIVDVSLDSGVAHASIRARRCDTLHLVSERGLSTVEFHEGRLAEARTARPPTRLGCVTLAGRKRKTRQTAVPGLCSPAQLPRLRRA